MAGRDELARRYRRLSRAQKLDRLAAICVAEARLAASKTELLAQLDDPDPIGKDFDAEEVACVMRVPSSTASSLLRHSSRLVECFPQAMDAMHAGELPVRSAHKLAEQALGLSDELLPLIEKTVLVKASRQTPGQFGRSLARAIAEVDTRTVERRHQLARTGRMIQWGPVDRDGMTDNYLRLPADEQATLRARVEAVADGWKGLDDRMADERRADALCALVGGLSGDVRAHVSVVVSMSTLLGVDDQPGRLNGQTIPAPLARALAHGEHATWRRLVTDPMGRIRDISAATYVPPKPMARFIRLRDERCGVPDLQPTRDPLRTRPHPSLGLRRHHLYGEPHAPLQPTPPPQTRRQLDPPPTRRRNSPMDNPHRPHLRQTTTRPTTARHLRRPAAAVLISAAGTVVRSVTPPPRR